VNYFLASGNEVNLLVEKGAEQRLTNVSGKYCRVFHSTGIHCGDNTSVMHQVGSSGHMHDEEVDYLVGPSS